VWFHTAGEAKFAVYDCIVSFDDKSVETSLRVYICYSYYYTACHSTTHVAAANCYQLSSVVCRFVWHLVSPEAIAIPFALRTRVGPRKDLLHIADRLKRILYCVHSTQYSHLVLDLDTHFSQMHFYYNSRFSWTFKFDHSSRNGAIVAVTSFCTLKVAKVVLNDIIKTHFSEIDRTDFGVICDTCVKPHLEYCVGLLRITLVKGWSMFILSTKTVIPNC